MLIRFYSFTKVHYPHENPRWPPYFQDGHLIFKMATICDFNDVADDQNYSSLSCMTMKFGRMLIRVHSFNQVG